MLLNSSSEETVLLYCFTNFRRNTYSVVFSFSSAAEGEIYLLDALPLICALLRCLTKKDVNRLLGYIYAWLQGHYEKRV